jgi:hypothetical protein
MGRQRILTGCADCAKCTTSHVGVGLRNTGRGAAAAATVGLSELGMAFTANCNVCGHKLSLHDRPGAQSAVSRLVSATVNPAAAGDGRPFPPSFYEGREMPAEPASSAPVVPSGPEAGWYTDPDGTPNHRWWDGQRWTEHRK